MITSRRLTDAERQHLDALNAAVVQAIQARTEWLDAKMHECSRLQIGDDIYDVNSGARLGKVTALYRFWRDRDDGIRDTSLDCQYEYDMGSRCFDNTSRQPGRTFGTREEALQRAERRAERLRAANQ